MWRVCSILAILLSVALMVGCHDDVTPPPASDTIDQLVALAGDIEEPPVYSERDTTATYEELRPTQSGQEIWTCMNVHRSIAIAPDEYPIFNPNAGVIYPGAALQGASIIRATPDPITATRGPGSIVITNVTGADISGVTVQEVTLPAVYDAANEVIAAQPEAFPANLFISVEQFHSREELSLILHANASFFGLFSSSWNFSLQSSDEYSHFLVRLHQSFYSLAFARPSRASDFFAPSVTSDDLAPYIYDGNPPVYVQEVNYGRLYYFLVEARASADTIKSTLEANFLFGSAGASVAYLSQLRDVRVQAFALGGNAAEALEAVQAGLYSGLKPFLASLEQGGQITMAKPLSYVVRSVRNDGLVKNGVATEYSVAECYPSGGLVTSPAPLSPANYEYVDNGCLHTSNSISWPFDWTDVSGAEQYQINVMQSSLGTVYDRYTTASNTTISVANPPAYTTSWSWMVRAKIHGYWSGWSRPASFRVERINTDCTTGVRLYADPNYTDTNQFFDYYDFLSGGVSGVPNTHIYGMKDNTTSVRIYNITKVRLFRDTDYKGPYIDLTASQANISIAPWNFNDRVSSLMMYP